MVVVVRDRYKADLCPPQLPTFCPRAAPPPLSPGKSRTQIPYLSFLRPSPGAGDSPTPFTPPTSQAPDAGDSPTPLTPPQGRWACPGLAGRRLALCTLPCVI